jgi:hypothetical protein
MKLDFSLTLPDELYAQLIDDCRVCEILPKQYAAEALESAIASRRLPKVDAGRYGQAQETKDKHAGTFAEHVHKTLRAGKH